MVLLIVVIWEDLINKNHKKETGRKIYAKQIKKALAQIMDQRFLNVKD
jgi:hypothetical protein